MDGFISDELPVVIELFCALLEIDILKAASEAVVKEFAF